MEIEKIYRFTSPVLISFVLFFIQDITQAAISPAAAAAMKEGGILIMSGILEGKETAVAQALEKEGLMVTDIGSQGEWRSVTAVKPVSGAR